MLRSKRAILIGAVPQSPARLQRLLKKISFRPYVDFLVAIDGGVQACHRQNLVPDLAIGDWDSLQNRRLLKSLNTISLPRDKDASDLHFALRVLKLIKPTEIIALAITRGRPDHHLAGIYEMAQATATLPGLERAWALDEEAEYHFLVPGKKGWRNPVRRGKTLSVFAVGEEVRGLTLKGMEYSLRGARLAASSRGLSNVSRGGVCEVSLRTGRALVVLPHRTSHRK